MLRVKPGEVIRNKQTREPFLIISKSPVGLSVVSLWQKIDPAPVAIVLHRAEKEFEPDKAFVDMSKEEADALKEKLPYVADIQEVLDNG